MANGKWQMANGKWQMANGKWQIFVAHCIVHVKEYNTIFTTFQ